ncbi:MAG: hypothetical protein RLZZ269_587 [Actinomycetota bacterium]
MEFVLNGQPVSVPSEGTLLSALRDRLGVRSAKDGCAPQGQCGCCTVLVDGEPRVACVTPVSRVSGRAVTTLEGVDDAVRQGWAEALCATGGSQCGFCTPGIIMRLLDVEPVKADVERSLLAHLCRCTGWQTIVEAAVERPQRRERDLDAAAERARIEGGALQRVSADVALGRGGFADDSAPSDSLVAVLAPSGEWVVAPSVPDARRTAGVVPGRRSTVGLTWPIDVPIERQHEFVRTLRTTWVEPAYLEPDAVWCTPGGEPVGPLTNGGAFGGKTTSWLRDEVRRLADEHGWSMRIVLSREDVVRLGAKRPPLAAGVRSDGTGVLWVRATPGARELVAAVAPDWEVVEIDVPGPRTSLDPRAALWAEIAVLRASVADHDRVVAPNGSWAEASSDGDVVTVRVGCGDVLDDVTLRSYCIGAAHMALGWIRSEGIAVDAQGTVHDLTIRSFGVLRAVDTPTIRIEVVDDGSPVRNVSDAVFAAVAAAEWRHARFAPRWPCARDGR